MVIYSTWVVCATWNFYFRSVRIIANNQVVTCEERKKSAWQHDIWLFAFWSFCDCVFGIFLYLYVCICLCVFVFFFCIFVFLIFSNHHHHHHHRLLSLGLGRWWLSRFSNELFSNFSPLPEVRSRSPKKGKSSEFNSRDDGIIIWKV